MTSTVQNRLHTSTNAPVAPRILVSIGYKGKTAGDLITALLEQRTRALIDVRLTPLSRKPGLSKTKLSETLAAAGIRNLHYRALGNPKDNRPGYRAGQPQSRAQDVSTTTMLRYPSTTELVTVPLPNWVFYTPNKGHVGGYVTAPYPHRASEDTVTSWPMTCTNTSPSSARNYATPGCKPD